MRHRLRPVGFLTALFAVLLGLAGCDDSPYSDSPRHAGNEFFLEIGESHFQKAYDNTAFAFQAQTTFKNFEAITREMGLSAGTVSCNWTKEEAMDREVKLTGDITAANGATIPAILTVIRERGSWRVFSMHIPGQSGNKDADPFTLLGKGASFSQLANREIPSEAALNKLALDNLLLFNSAIQKRSFGEFYSKVALAWQAQLTETQLKQAFQPFIDGKVNISGIRTLTPVFDVPPEINTEGILLLKGHYDTTPYSTFFVLRFSYEFPFWKLYGVEVQIHG
jgi:hypothetical protein